MARRKQGVTHAEWRRVDTLVRSANEMRSTKQKVSSPLTTHTNPCVVISGGNTP